MQGQTIKPPQAVVIDMKEANNPAQCYVMLSRAQNLQQIYILDNLYTHNWKTSDNAIEELDRLTREAINNVLSANEVCFIKLFLFENIINFRYFFRMEYCLKMVTKW